MEQEVGVAMGGEQKGYQVGDKCERFKGPRDITRLGSAYLSTNQIRDAYVYSGPPYQKYTGYQP